MAAQEKAKQAQALQQQQSNPPVTQQTEYATLEPNASSFDFLNVNKVTANENSILPPPPAFEEAFAAPPPALPLQHQPPSFNDDLLFLSTNHSEKPSASGSAPSQHHPFGIMIAPPAYEETPSNNPPPQVFPWDQDSPAPLVPPSASAPSYEDLMEHQYAHMQPPTIPASPSWEPMPPPSQPSSNQDDADSDVIAAILALDGLSAAEKESMIAEQKKIMASIEKSSKKKTSGTQHSAALSAADAFEQRSLQAVVGAGTNSSRSSIPSNMPFDTTGLSQSEIDQLHADMKLAEQLQQEEYEQSDRQQRVGSTGTNANRAVTRTNATLPTPSSSTKEQSWFEWLGWTSSTPSSDAPASVTSSDARRERERMIENEISAANAARGGSTSSSSAEQLFASVTDTLSSAATYAINTTTGSVVVPERDNEGNVHGVDSTSLLAVTQVGRNNNASNTDQTNRATGGSSTSFW